MKTKQTEPECISLEKLDADAFMKAVEITCRQQLLSNDSIYRKDEFTIEIYETKASFLLNIGINYGYLIRKDNE